MRNGAERLIATLGSAVTGIYSIQETSRVLACTVDACVEIDVAADDGGEGAVGGRTRPFARLGKPAVGGGGFHDHVFVVEEEGMRHERRSGAIDAPITSVQDGLEIVRSIIAGVRVTSDGAFQRIALRVADVKRPSYRSDDVEMLALDDWTSLGRYSPPSRDCFRIDRVAISPNGAWLGMTGLDTVYTSIGDWAYGQLQRAFIFRLKDADPTVLIDLGETSRPSEHEEQEIALGDAWWFVGSHAVPARPLLAEREELVLDSETGRLSFESITALELQSGDGYAAITPASLIFGHPAEPTESDVSIETSARPTALATAFGALLVGYADGRVVSISR